MTDLSDEEIEFAQRMFDLARDGATEELAGYVDAGLPVNLTNSSGDTLLMLAAYRKQEETVLALLQRGADTDRLNHRGQTALAAAAFRNSAGIVTALLAAGADPHAGSPSALEAARFYELPEMVALLDRD